MAELLGLGFRTLSMSVLGDFVNNRLAVPVGTTIADRPADAILDTNLFAQLSKGKTATQF